MYPRQVSSMIGRSCCQVALGVCHSLALTVSRTIWSWRGFLYTGHGEDDDVETARELDAENLKGQNIFQICAGRFHSLALSSIGDVFSWGSGSMGRLGLASTGEVACPEQVCLGKPLPGWMQETQTGTCEAQERFHCFELFVDHLETRAMLTEYFTSWKYRHHIGPPCLRHFDPALPALVKLEGIARKARNPSAKAGLADH